MASAQSWLAQVKIFSTLEISIIVALTCFYLAVSWVLRRRTLPNKCPKAAMEDLPVVGALRFFDARWDFFRQCAAESTSGNFSFHVGPYPAVGLSGHLARQTFLESKSLALAEAYSKLLGTGPPLPAKGEDGTDITGSSDFNAWFTKEMTRLIKRENICRGLPRLLNDCNARLMDLKSQDTKITDPFESIYRIVYQLTMRTVGCKEIADDPALLDQTLQLYEKIEKCSTLTPTGVVLPWLPRPASLQRTYHGTKLYMIFEGIVKRRKQSEEKFDDALQVLVDQNIPVVNILAFVIGSLTAGLFNTGVIAAYLLVGLTQRPEWLEKIRAEVVRAGRKYRTEKDSSLVDSLNSMPIEGWEKEFPSIDFVLKECQRLQLYGSMLRQNLSGADIAIGDEVIPDGAFAMYHIADVHMNPQIYKNPEEFDPDRYLPGRAEDKKEANGWIGWGAGRHPCPGMKFAKLEINVIVALFVATFDFSLCDSQGNITSGMPPLELNSTSVKKPAQHVYLKYSERDLSTSAF